MFKEKLVVARKLRNTSARFSQNSEHNKLFKKCYRTYVIECIFKGKNNFTIRFRGQYLRSFRERANDWYNYIIDNVTRFLYLVFIPKKFRSRNKYPFLYCTIYKPIHLKVTNAPNEFMLEIFLELNGLKIVEEYLHSVDTVYDIGRI